VVCTSPEAPSSGVLSSPAAASPFPGPCEGDLLDIVDLLELSWTVLGMDAMAFSSLASFSFFFFFLSWNAGVLRYMET
jgi:hypothetical protein